MANKRDIVKDIFFNEIINEAKTGEIVVDDLIFNVGFNSCIEGNLSSGVFGDSKPILMINNSEQFINLLCQYVDECDKHDNMFSNYDLKTRIKGYLSLVWSNAIYEDFASPLMFLRKRIGFYQDKNLNITEEYQQEVEQLYDSKILISNNFQDIRMETPNLFKIKIKKEENEYELPSISYGIYNNECYIYAIQNKQNSNLNNYQKRIKRCIYKMNAGVEQFNSEEDLENISEVSPSTLISLSIFFDVLNKNNIDKVKVVSFLPIRYNSKELAFEKKYEDKIKSKKYSDDELKKMLLEYKIENLRIQKNLSEKLIRNFRRLETQFDNCIITSFPMEFDEYMHVTVKEFKKGENEFLNSIINNSCKTSKICKI